MEKMENGKNQFQTNITEEKETTGIDFCFKELFIFYHRHILDII